MADAAVATQVADVCRAHGLEAFTTNNIPSGANWEDVVREALVESRAVLIIVSASEPSPFMLLEIGGARAWNKPIFAVVSDPARARLPSVLTGTPLYTPGRVEEVVQAIKLIDQAFSPEDRALLARIYKDVGVAVDELALESDHLGQLVKRFNKGTGKQASEEQLLAELLRMRKQGLLKRRSAG
jgi:hypothetical protein